MIVSTTELGELLGLTERHIYNLEKSGVLHKEDKNAWDASKNIQSYTMYKIDLEAQDSDIGKVRIRRELAEAKLKELAYKEKIGALITLETIAKELEDIAIVVSNKLYALPHIITRKHKLSAGVKNELVSQIELILQELKDPSIYTDLSQKIEEAIQQDKQKASGLDKSKQSTPKKAK